METESVRVRGLAMMCTSDGGAAPGALIEPSNWPAHMTLEPRSARTARRHEHAQSRSRFRARLGPVRAMSDRR